MQFKYKYLRACKDLCRPAYSYSSEAFTVDLENGCVRFGFTCLIPGNEGRGTQFLFFDTDGKVRILHIFKSCLHD